jgi:hypothetical protein
MHQHVASNTETDLRASAGAIRPGGKSLARRKATKAALVLFHAPAILAASGERMPGYPGYRFTEPPHWASSVVRYVSGAT